MKSIILPLLLALANSSPLLIPGERTISVPEGPLSHQGTSSNSSTVIVSNSTSNASGNITHSSNVNENIETEPTTMKAAEGLENLGLVTAVDRLEGDVSASTSGLGSTKADDVISREKASTAETPIAETVTRENDALVQESGSKSSLPVSESGDGTSQVKNKGAMIEESDEKHGSSTAKSKSEAGNIATPPTEASTSNSNQESSPSAAIEAPEKDTAPVVDDKQEKKPEVGDETQSSSSGSGENSMPSDMSSGNSGPAPIADKVSEALEKTKVELERKQAQISSEAEQVFVPGKDSKVTYKTFGFAFTIALLAASAFGGFKYWQYCKGAQYPMYKTGWTARDLSRGNFAPLSNIQTNRENRWSRQD